MANHQWVSEYNASILVCDAEGVILEMNEAAAAGYASDGGRKLIGANALDCHPEPARAQFEQMLASGEPHVYTIEKRGVHKLIYQSPWYENGEYRGFIELSLEIPLEMPHFIRQG